MTREQQMRVALRRLKPSAHQRAKCRAEIENALAIMADASIAHNIWAAERSKAYTNAKRVYLVALRRLRSATRALLDAGGGVSLDFSLERIEREIRACEPRRFKIIHLSKMGEHQVLREGEALRVGATKPTFAVALAYELLKQWGGKIVKTPRGDWGQLSAILYGDLDIDLSRHLRKFRPELSPFRRWKPTTTYKSASK
jgi:hypothetical protein